MTVTRTLSGSVNEPTLYVAFELGKKEWKLAMTSGFGIRPWLRTVASRDWGGVGRAIAQGRARFGLSTAAPVVSCYEAGRDGFWIHRALLGRGVRNRVVDSASIEVNRRARRAKTDRLDALKLVTMLVRVCYGEKRVWSEVCVPTVAEEAARQVSRERTALTQDQTRLVNQMRGWLATWGATLPSRRRGSWWTTVRDWAGAPLPAEVQARLARAEGRLQTLEAQIAELDAQQQAAVTTAAPTSAVRQLVQLKGVATTSAAVLLNEGLVWRAFRNRRQIGGLLGFAPTPYNSGDTERERGISRAGNARLQAISIQLAWNWVRWQPHSALTHWYQANFGKGKRARRIGIVALARKLVIALWRYVTQGVVPEGARLKIA
jgi:transposase